MSALNLSRLSKLPPEPHTVSHGGKISVGYTCHMAVIHWALMDRGHTQQKANDILGKFARSTCPACLGKGAVHGSLSPTEYGKLFCFKAEQIPTQNDLYDDVEVGDILITDNKVWPAHSMVLRQKRGRDHVTIRGFNNFGTLGTGVRDQYDDLSRNITQNKYWTNGPAGKFGRAGVNLFVIPHNVFMPKVKVLEMMFG